MEIMRFQSSYFQLKNSNPVFWKRYSFSRKSGFKVLKTFKISTDCLIKTCNLPEGYFENPLYRFLEESTLFLISKKSILYSVSTQFF